jgi:hypothetical protein
VPLLPGGLGELVEADAIDELHGVVGRAVDLANVEDRHHVAVVQSGGGLRLAQ